MSAPPVVVFTKEPCAIPVMAKAVVVACVRSVEPERVEEAALREREMVVDPLMKSAVPVAFPKIVFPTSVEEAA